ncbi:MAG: DUF805 domain-containing protein [Bacteroidetes bacterium]|nr:DUF805 domain-containing protein [Bacteroidota bacterium]
MNWFIKALKQYGDFKTRARRMEYWMFAVCQLVFLIPAMLLDSLLGTNFEPLPYGFIYMITALVFFVPGLAVFVRRMHDVGKSGWFILIAFIPLIGAIWLLVLLFTDGQPGENKWGPNPKEANLDLMK